MNINKVHCFFEQSGTFKNEFKKLGIMAYDYDIANEFETTDIKVDLFSEIRSSFSGGFSIFDGISKDDLIIAFFPCIRFEDQITLWFRGDNFSQKNWSLVDKLQYDLALHNDLANYYEVITKLVLICINKKLRLIIENPYGKYHYLNRYWCLEPTFIDYDRRENGDFFKKPTQYWFINCEPSYNIIFEPQNINSISCKNAICNASKFYSEMGVKSVQTCRSMIHPDYANKFIRQYIL